MGRTVVYRVSNGIMFCGVVKRISASWEELPASHPLRVRIWGDMKKIIVFCKVAKMHTGIYPVDG